MKSLQDKFADCEFDLYTRLDARIRGWVRLFFVDGPRGFCQRHGKSYLTRRRRGGEGGGGGLLTGRAIPWLSSNGCG